jgi:alkyl sulfatase BDS1-like metallo-beta-lactamase superfamily hydrolase
MNRIPASFSPGDIASGPEGQLAHPLTIAHSDRLQRKLYQVGDSAWSLVGNGLSNQSFVQGPEGIIAIDTGECVEEMESALRELREHTDVPIVACIYTHFHYVGGTTALLKSTGDANLPIWGHSGIEANLRRFGGEVGPRGARGLVHQFGVVLPTEGADGLVNVGLGRFLRNPEHAPFTNGHVAANQTFDTPVETTIAGLQVHLLPAPSDATDSVTIWFPELQLAVNNLLWPAFFNVFAIRGEEYRDPRILLGGLDELGDLRSDYLMGAHGPPLEGRQEIAELITNYRDGIQYLWDQTVRGANQGLTLDELIAFVQLPEHFRQHFTTQQLYGVAEHHVRQIYTGLFGWFDEDESKLFPTPAPERAQKLIAGFGGKDKVRGTIDQALNEQDYRWAIELATWLVRDESDSRGRCDAGETQDRTRLASALRGVAQSTTAANVRNWCLTRALELDGSLSLDRFREHRFRASELLAAPAVNSVATLRVLLRPERASGLNSEVCIRFDDGSSAGLRIRNQVAIPTAGHEADCTLTINHVDWATVLAGKARLVQFIEEGKAEVFNPEKLSEIFSCFDLTSLHDE